MNSLRLVVLATLVAGVLGSATATAHTTTTSEWDPATHQMVQVKHWSLFRRPIVGTTTTSVWDPSLHRMVNVNHLKLNSPIHIRPPGKHWWNRVIVHDTH